MWLFGLASLILWLVILLLPWRPWGVREAFDPAQQSSVANSRQHPENAVTVLIPARNEAAVISQTLSSLAAQDPPPHIILVDDQSSDQTIEIARSLNLNNLIIVHGEKLPAGWSGKLWALEQGFSHVQTDLVLLLDADIDLEPGTLSALLEKLESENLDFLSLMARLRMKSFWEKLLLPSYIYFFKLLYPFKLSNSGHPYIAAAAGGCLLTKSEIIREMGGFASLRSALIDDCTLAKNARGLGKSTWIGLTRSAVSLRTNDHLSDIWNMVARTAYTQLNYSPILLIVCSVLMFTAYIVPLILLVQFTWLGILILTLMLMTFVPVILYYNLNPVWIFGLPISGILYLLMTFTSAIRYFRGERSQWKGRTYT